MRTYTTLFILFFFSTVFSQYYIKNTNYFEEYLLAQNDGNYIHSIDSIIDGANKFIVNDKSSDFNITNATIHLRSVNLVQTFAFMKVNYHNDHQIKTLLVENIQNGDTLKYLLYDKEGKLLIEQYQWNLDCGTGSPNNAEKTFYKYDNNDNIIEKTIQIKWTYNCYIAPYNQWVDYRKFKYTYEDNILVEEMQHANKWHEGVDTFINKLYPIYNTFYKYYDFDSLEEKRLKTWNLEKEIWVNKELNAYNYINDSTTNVYSQWSEDKLDWQKKNRSITFYHDNTYDNSKQTWNESENKWHNNTWIKRTYSGIPGLINSKSLLFIKGHWFNHSRTSFNLKGDTIVKHRYVHHNADYEYNYLYDSKEQLLEKWWYIYNYDKNIYKHTINTYNHFDNIIENYVATYEPNSKHKLTKETYKNYYWHSEKINLTKYIPFVDSKNEWNMGYWSKIGDTLSSVTNYTFSKKETLLHGKKYHQLIQSNSVTPPNFKNYFREENGKVWKFNANGEELWLDFTLEKGDTFSTQYGSFLLLVDSTNYITMENGEQRKVLFLKCFEGGSIHTRWIEGIGEISGIDYNRKGCLTGSSSYLLCFHNNQQLIYKNPYENDCWITSEKDIKINKLQIIPNPAFNTIYVKGNGNINEIQIYNLAGQLLIKSIYKTINIQNLNPGSYIVKMKSENQISIGKFVKL